MHDHISQQTRDLMARAREIALEFGAEGISSIHIFLADCSINNIFSIKNFAFKSEADYQNFYKSQFIDQDLRHHFPNPESITLTIPAERAIKRAIIEQRKTSDLSLEPQHIFLAMSKLKNSQFVSIFPNNINLHDELLEYYNKSGVLNYVKLKTKLIDRIKAYVKNK